MKIRRLMTSSVYSCSPEDTLTDAARIMWDKDCGCLPVVDADRRVIAMITDRDICMAAYTQGAPLHAARVASAMSKSLVVCSPDASHAELERLLREKQLRRVPVVDDEGHLLGIATLGDLAHRAQQAGLRRPLALTAIGKSLVAILERREPRTGERSAAE
jgi:CBS domain-containing protein